MVGGEELEPSTFPMFIGTL